MISTCTRPASTQTQGLPLGCIFTMALPHPHLSTEEEPSWKLPTPDHPKWVKAFFDTLGRRLLRKIGDIRSLKGLLLLWHIPQGF